MTAASSRRSSRTPPAWVPTTSRSRTWRRQRRGVQGDRSRPERHRPRQHPRPAAERAVHRPRRAARLGLPVPGLRPVPGQGRARRGAPDARAGDLRQPVPPSARHRRSVAAGASCTSPPRCTTTGSRTRGWTAPWPSGARGAGGSCSPMSATCSTRRSCAGWTASGPTWCRSTSRSRRASGSQVRQLLDWAATHGAQVHATGVDLEPRKALAVDLGAVAGRGRLLGAPGPL